MIAIGPIFDEQKTMPEHKPLRDKTAALERAVADELKHRGYTVLGTHPRASEPDSALLEQVMTKLQAAFPSRNEEPKPLPRYQPVKLRGDGPTASEIILQDRRERF